MGLSFLNGKSPFDEAEEKLEAGETVNGRPKLPSAPVMGWQDGVFLLLLIGLIVGGYQYYKYVKKNCAETFARCDALYVAAETDMVSLPAAEACYDSTWELGFVSDSLEVLRQERLGAIADKRTLQKDVLEDMKDAVAAGDTAKAAEILSGYKGAMLLNGYDQEEWNSLAKNIVH